VTIMGQKNQAGPSLSDRPHEPVLLAEVLDALAPLAGKRVVDGTFGAGGYSRALLQAGAVVTAIDRDPNVGAFAAQLEEEFPDRFNFISGTFSQLDMLIDDEIDAIVLDIGVSSMQLDEAERGFSFMRDGPLDMRMSGAGTSAADLVNDLDEKQLAELLFAFGEERKSRRIAAAIVGVRGEKPIVTTLELAQLIEKTIGRKPGEMHPATRSFQALRIAVNAEFDELVGGLFAAERKLAENGILAVVTFHSLEDRIVKRFFASGKAGATQSRHMPQQIETPSLWKNIAKPAKATAAELERNPRARSATLRSARRTNAPARPTSAQGLGVPLSKLMGAA